MKQINKQLEMRSRSIIFTHMSPFVLKYKIEMLPQCSLHRQSSSAPCSHTYQLYDTCFVNSDYVFTSLFLQPWVACDQGPGIFIYFVAQSKFIAQHNAWNIGVRYIFATLIS